MLVGKPAHDFTANAIMPNNQIEAQFNLKNYIKGKIGVLFFYPLNFTFVCPSEILEFNDYVQRFEQEGAVIIAVSVDSHFNHLAYKNTPVNQGGIGNVQFPMVADIKKTITKDYGVLFDDAIALRATFMIDQDFKVRHQVINDLPLGRNIEEAFRMVKALKYHQEFGEVCPANWDKGKKGMKPTKEGVTQYLAEKYKTE